MQLKPDPLAAAEAILIYLRRPSEDEIQARLSSKDVALSYGEVAATSGEGTALSQGRLSGYNRDRHEFPLGTGRELFERAQTALLAWRHFEIPWLEFHGATTPVHEGQVVATLISIAGVWFLNPCRVIYAEPPQEPYNAVAFAYGTLRGHAESGEERFQVSFDPATQEVQYEIIAFSRPAVVLSKLGYPLARRLQRRFARSSAEALAKAAA